MVAPANARNHHRSLESVFAPAKEDNSLRKTLNALSWELRRYSQRLHMSRAQVMLFTPGFHATVVYRLGHLLLPVTRKKSGLNIVVALFMAFLRRFTEIITGIYISPEAEIGEGLLMIHFGGEEYFGHPNKRFRLALSRSHERYSREMSRLWRSWTIEAKP